MVSVPWDASGTIHYEYPHKSAYNLRLCSAHRDPQETKETSSETPARIRKVYGTTMVEPSSVKAHKGQPSKQEHLGNTPRGPGLAPLDFEPFHLFVSVSSSASGGQSPSDEAMQSCEKGRLRALPANWLWEGLAELAPRW